MPFTWTDREPLLELDFAVEEFERRLAAAQEEMGRQGLDALIVYGGAGSESDVRYLSGFPSWWGESLVVVPADGDPVFVTNAIFHGEPMHSNVQKSWIRDLRPLLNAQSTVRPRSVVDLAVDAVKEWGSTTGRVGLADSRRVPARVDRELQEKLPAAEILDGSDVLKRLRRLKSPAEIELLRVLARATSAGMNAGLAAVRPGVSESEIAAAVHQGCIAAGAERMFFGCLTSAGPRSFMKNVWPRLDRLVDEKALVVIDIGAQLGGYQSDMSRNIVAGEVPDEVERMLEACLEAEEAGIARTEPGVPVGQILDVMSSVVAEHGFAEWDWTTGHGYGLDIVEGPFFYPGNPQPLEPGMCFYIEPMIVPTGVGTICIEDMVVVTEAGCEQLTTSVKKTW